MKKWLPRLILYLLAAYGLYRLWDVLRPAQKAPTPFTRLHVTHLPARAGAGNYGAVVFIHGLQGDYLDTWKPAQSDVTFMKLINEDEELKRYDVYSVGYPTKITADMTSISAVMDGVAEFLDQKTRDCTRLALVCHSLGGIVGRGALWRSGFAQRPYQRCTFITLGTPFKGSSLAGYGRLLGGLESYQLKALARLDPNSEILNGDWSKVRQIWGPKLRHCCGWEKKGINGKIMVVEEDSATAGHLAAMGDEKSGFDADHVSISKPPDAKCEVFTRVKQWIIGSPSGGPVDLIEDALPSYAGVQRISGEFTITKDRKIHPGCKLIIAPGSTIKLRNGAIIDCEGIMIAAGEKDKPITFDLDETSASEATLMLRGPFVEGSKLSHCHFQHGNGVVFEPSDPRRDEKRDPVAFWYQLVRRASEGARAEYKNRFGGAVVVWNGSQVRFENCSFHKNDAWNGGAVNLLNSRLVYFESCDFRDNIGAYGGGAVSMQCSEVTFRNCVFSNNHAGIPENEEQTASARISKYYSAPQPMDKLKSLRGSTDFACGGAVYVGYRSQIVAKICEFTANKAGYVGGAVYLLETHPSGSGADPSLFTTPRFINNQCRGGGGGMFIDGSSRVNLTGPTWSGNTCQTTGLTTGQPVTLKGHHLMDDSHVVSVPTESGLKMNDTIFLPDEGRSGFDRKVEFKLEKRELPGKEKKDGSSEPTQPQKKDAAATFDHFARAQGRFVSTPARPTAPPLAIEESLMKNPKCFKAAEGRVVDTIVIHHVSAINWSADKLLQVGNRTRVMEFERLHPVSDRKFDFKTCKEIFEIYGVSAHYMIDREGHVIRLVHEKDVSFHAGSSRMPDGRKNVNDFSIGIELISSHPDDDPDVKSGKTPAYTDAQYDSLAKLIKDIQTRHTIPITSIIGHDQIAAGRKKDPGPNFDWKRLLTAIERPDA